MSLQPAVIDGLAVPLQRRRLAKRALALGALGIETRTDPRRALLEDFVRAEAAGTAVLERRWRDRHLARERVRAELASHVVDLDRAFERTARDRGRGIEPRDRGVTDRDLAWRVCCGRVELHEPRAEVGARDRFAVAVL